MADGVVTIPIPGQAVGGNPASRREHHGPATLGEFLAGAENRLVAPAVNGVLAGHDCPYNPLVLYGPSGTGKSHLAAGLAAAWTAHARRGEVICVTCIDFARELADAIESQAIDDFRAKYRRAAMAVFEDVAELAKKDAAQEEFIHTLDALLGEGAQVVVTARASPCEMAELRPRLRARLCAGLAVPLAPPGLETRLAILRRWAELRGIKASAHVLELLARGFKGTVPQLAGAMLRLEIPARHNGKPIDAEAVRTLCSEADTCRKPSVREIAAATARHFSLRLAELRGSQRRRPIVVARGVAMLLARKLTEESLQQIGAYFARRDHTTVMHACQKTKELSGSDPAVRQALKQLERKLLQT
jgi:chromosomal replication initiator protein